MIVSRNMMRSLTMRALPFSDAVSEQLPLGQLLRLSLFQISVGMAAVMLLGTLNRVMIVELSVPATIVAIMIAIPVLVAPFRALLGFRSDNYRSAIGWKRIPYLSLAADRATEETRPQVVALLYVMFLIGMGVSAIIVGALLQNFSDLRLVQVVQGTAVVTIVLNMVALWKQEKVNPMTKEERAAPKPQFRDAWDDLTSGGHAGRLLVVVFLGTMAFNMQDVLLEPYGGEVAPLSSRRRWPAPRCSLRARSALAWGAGFLPWPR